MLDILPEERSEVRSQVTVHTRHTTGGGHGSGQVTGHDASQVTGQVACHRAQVRSNVRSQIMSRSDRGLSQVRLQVSSQIGKVRTAEG